MSQMFGCPNVPKTDNYLKTIMHHNAERKCFLKIIDHTGMREREERVYAKAFDDATRNTDVVK